MKIVFADFGSEDPVGFLGDRHSLAGDFAEDSNRKTRAREGLAVHHLVRKTKLAPNLSHFVLEQPTQRLDDLELHPIRKSANVVVGFDLGCCRRAALNHVRIQSSLGKEVAALKFV